MKKVEAGKLTGYISETGKARVAEKETLRSVSLSSGKSKAKAGTSAAKTKA
jgi:hypothetical protein